MFEFGTPISLTEANDQYEFNFHNIATGFSEQAYYLGGFILLTLLPFMRDSARVFMERLTIMRKLTPFLPSAWLVVPFSVIARFCIIQESKCVSVRACLYIYIYDFVCI